VGVTVLLRNAYINGRVARFSAVVALMERGMSNYLMHRGAAAD
jgi:hypothetical protein